ALAAGDVPSGSPHYVQNGTTAQAGFNFNVGGTGTANIFNAGTQFTIATNRVLSIGGTNNLFAGVGSGSANPSGTGNAFFGSSSGSATTTGSGNAFFGFGAGVINTLGSNNTALGSGADFSANNLSFATAIGSGAVASLSNSIYLGRAADTVRIPGGLNVSGAFSGTFTVPVANLLGVVPTVNGGTGVSNAGTTGNVLRSNAGVWQAAPLAISDLPSLDTIYIRNNVSAQTGNFNITGNGIIGGNLNVAGTLTASIPASSITTGTIPIARGGTGLSTVGGTGTFLRSDGSAWQTSLLTSGDIPAGSPHYIQNGITPQAGFNFNVGGNGTIGGNLSVAGTFTGSIAASSITSGTLGIARGGTGLSAAGGIGTFLRSDGSAWSPATLIAADIPSLSNTYITTSGTLQPGANLNIGGNGAFGGNLNVTGTLTAGTFSLPASSITSGTLGIARGGTGLSAAGGIGTFLRSDGSAWSPATLIAADIPSLSNTYITTSGALQSGASFNIGGNGTIGGNLNVTGTLSAGAFSLPASSITSGTLPIARGGTGLSAAGANGTFLRSNGTIWSPATLVAGDIPSGSPHYVQNGTTAQVGFNFNVGGNGTIGGNGRILGDFGIGTPTALTTLDVRGNGFFGLTAAPDSAASNAVYVNNDGGDAANSFRIDASGDNLAIAGRSATGAGVGTSITFRTAAAEGGEADRLKINANGTVVVNQLGAAGAIALCMNASNELATCSAPPPLVDPKSIDSGKSAASLLKTVDTQQAQIISLQKELSERKAAEQAQKERIDRQQAELDALKKLVCAGNSAASICKQ
ncbi:MAG: hypothetical protein ABI539_00010, partial [Acidobacteriota bacterium]